MGLILLPTSPVPREPSVGCTYRWWYQMFVRRWGWAAARLGGQPKAAGSGSGLRRVAQSGPSLERPGRGLFSAQHKHMTLCDLVVWVPTWCWTLSRMQSLSQSELQPVLPEPRAHSGRENWKMPTGSSQNPVLNPAGGSPSPLQRLSQPHQAQTSFHTGILQCHLRDNGPCSMPP